MTKAEEKKEEKNIEAEGAETESAETEGAADATVGEEEETAAETAVEDEVLSLEDELAALKEEMAEKDDRHLRLQAEFDNFRRRTLKEKDELRQNATADLMSDLLPVLDNFDRALLHAEESPVLEGIVMVQKQMLEILERAGLTKVGAVDEPFDPNLHDAIMQEEREDKEAGIILEVLQPGYKLHEKLLRPAMVKVSGCP